VGTVLAEAAQAQLQYWYPQFGPVVPPRETAAVRAWIGRIQPFPDETEFLPVMAHLQQGKTVRVEREGSLTHPYSCTSAHEFEIPFFPAISASFEVLLLEFPAPRHPRVYGVFPEISRRRYPHHPHLRDDQQILFDGRPLHALCVYLASDGVLARDDMQLVHVLDFTSMYLAKHAVWVATKRLERFDVDTGIRTIEHPLRMQVTERPFVFDGIGGVYAGHYRTDVNFERPEETVQRWLRDGHCYVHYGAWVGPAAPHFVDELMRQFNRTAECPCGSGLSYGKCCRELHESA